MSRIADEARAELFARELQRTAEERMLAALEMGRAQIALYMAVNGVDRATALQAFRAANRKGRRKCSFLPEDGS